MELQENNFFRLFTNNIPKIIQLICSKMILDASKKFRYIEMKQSNNV